MWENRISTYGRMKLDSYLRPNPNINSSVLGALWAPSGRPFWGLWAWRQGTEPDVGAGLMGLWVTNSPPKS